MPMSNSEEALDDFPAENPISPAEFMVGAYRAESTDEWTAASGITSKIHPLYDGVTSWFKCEELIEDRFDLAVLEVSKGGAALKNRLFSELQKSIKGRLNRESLRADDGVKYFRGTLRPHYVKGAQSVFFWCGTAGDPREAQRERLTSSLFSPVNITADTLVAVQTVFVELFCAPENSMENPSLFMSGHGGSTNRTFIVEDYPEDEYGQWATDEVTGEQGYTAGLAVQKVSGSPSQKKKR